MTTKNQFVIGVDEVGWGCVAGPIVVCAAHVPFGGWDALREQGFRDSKAVGNRLKVNPNSKRTRISQGKCDMLADWLNAEEQRGLASWAIVEVDPITIDLMTPMDAKNRAFRSAIMRLMNANGWTSDDVTIIVDGNQLIPLPETFAQAAIPKADDSVMPVAVASVLAKSKRDRFMRLLHDQYPAFGFDDNVGYPTKAHLEALIRLGPVKGVHRMHYLKKWVMNWYQATYTFNQQAKSPPPQWLLETGWLGDAYAR